MAAQLESKSLEVKSLEAQIADCCHAMYWTSEPEVAMENWTRMRALKEELAKIERLQFMREASKRS